MDIIILIAIYLFPALIAMMRKHHNWPAILVLNLVLGWTLLGWLIALIWAATAIRRPVEA